MRKSSITSEMRRKAEEIRLATPGPVAKHLNKRISLPISLKLSAWGIHPNLITFFNFCLGLTTGFCIANGSYWISLLGALTFQMVSIFDGCDGEVAKLTGKTSKFGQYFDTIADNSALASFLIGLFIAYTKGSPPSFIYIVGALLLLGLAGLYFHMISFLKTTNSASLVTYDKEYINKIPKDRFKLLVGFINFGKIFMRKDVFSLAFLFFALINKLDWILYSTLLGIWASVSILTFLKFVPDLIPEYEYAEEENNHL